MMFRRVTTFSACGSTTSAVPSQLLPTTSTSRSSGGVAPAGDGKHIRPSTNTARIDVQRGATLMNAIVLLSARER